MFPIWKFPPKSKEHFRWTTTKLFGSRKPSSTKITERVIRGTNTNILKQKLKVSNFSYLLTLWLVLEFIDSFIWQLVLQKFTIIDFHMKVETVIFIIQMWLLMELFIMTICCTYLWNLLWVECILQMMRNIRLLKLLPECLLHLLIKGNFVYILKIFL